MTRRTPVRTVRSSLIGMGRRLPGPVRRTLRPAARALGRRTDDVQAPPYRSLDAVGLDTGTNKSSELMDYLGIYEQVLGHLRNKRFQLVEIGVNQGSSARMWADYFWRARIVGIDIDPTCKEHATDRIRIIIGNQGRPAFLARMARRLRPLVLVDDGSHKWTHQIDTFRALWPVVRPGGYFVVEDIHTSFGDDYAKTYGHEGGETAYDYVAGIAEGIVAGIRAKPPRDDFEAYCRATVESVVFLRYSVIFKKRSFRQDVYRTRSLAELSDEAVTVDLGAPYSRVQGELVSASEYVQKTFRAMLDDDPAAVPPASVATLSDVTVTGSGVVLVGRHSIVRDTLGGAAHVRRAGPMYRPTDGSIWVNQDQLTVRKRYPAVPGVRHVLVKQMWDANYGHWLIDGLPRLALLGDDRDGVVLVANKQGSKQMQQVVTDSLALAGFTGDQVMFVDGRPRTFERLTVLGEVTQHPVRKSPLAIRYLEDLASGVEPAGIERIYLSRNLGQRRRLVNEEDAFAVLEKYGYTLVHPEALSFEEQVALFRSATHVVGNMGAGLSNLAFSPIGVTVLALATERMNHDFFYDLVCHKAGRYRGLQGEAVDAEPTIGSDFTVDIDSLTQCLDWAHGAD